MGQTAVIPAQIVDVAARSLLGNNTASADAAQTISFSTASTGHVLTVQGDGSVAFAAVSAGIGGSTGSTDNAVLRADGTGGATLQTSGWIVPDIYTASPNATVNHLSLQATGASTNVSVSIVPKGNGAFSLAVPDNAGTGGNVRGTHAVDLQLSRGNAANVASGNYSFLVGREGKAAGGESSVIGGRYSEANARYAIAGGEYCRANGEASFAICSDSVASAAYSVATGRASLANRYGQRSHSSSSFAAGGDCQAAEIVLRGTTTTNAAVRLRPDGSTQRLTIASGQVCQYLLIITGVRNGGADVATYMRQVTIKNIGGTTSLVGTVNTIGTDEAAGTSLSVTADDTNDDLAVEPTGVSGQTWRWQCVVHGGEIGHG